MNRYTTNLGTISKEENKRLHRSRVCVIGCGGLGGYIIEMLARLGIGHITAVDSDGFDLTNLNRQILSNEKNLGKPKALMAKERIGLVNSEVKVNPIVSYLDRFNAKEILEDHDLVIDGLDNIESRLVLEEACEELEIPLIHGAIAGLYGQVSTVFPGDRTISKIYRKGTSKGVEGKLGIPAFTPPLIASIEVSEAVKVLLDRGGLLRGKLLLLDLADNEFMTIEI